MWWGASLVAQSVAPTVQETWVRSLGQKNPLEKEIVIQSSILAWEIPWTEEPGSPWGHKESDTTEWVNHHRQCAERDILMLTSDLCYTWNRAYQKCTFWSSGSGLCLCYQVSHYLSEMQINWVSCILSGNPNQRWTTILVSWVWAVSWDVGFLALTLGKSQA